MDIFHLLLIFLPVILERVVRGQEEREKERNIVTETYLLVVSHMHPDPGWGLDL